MDCKITQSLLYNDIKELLEIKCTQKNSQDKKNEAIIATLILNKFASICIRFIFDKERAKVCNNA